MFPSNGIIRVNDPNHLGPSGDLRIDGFQVRQKLVLGQKRYPLDNAARHGHARHVCRIAGIRYEGQVAHIQQAGMNVK